MILNRLFASFVEFIISSDHGGDEDWIAVYRKGDSNDWDNVIDWAWVKDGDNNFDLSGVSSGTFELRLFYDNSYTVATKTEFEFNGGNGGGDDKPFKDITVNAGDIKLSPNFNSADDGDWVGVFRSGDDYNRDNLVAWNYLYNGYEGEVQVIGDMPNGQYDVVYFTQDSYTQKGETSTLSVEGAGNGGKKHLVKKSFDRDNDGEIDNFETFTYHSNGNIKTKTNHYNGNTYTTNYDKSGKIVYDGYAYEYNDHGDRVKTYRNGKLDSYTTYVYSDSGKILKEEGWEYSEKYDDELIYVKKSKYDEEDRLIEYFADSFDSNPTHYTLTYNEQGKKETKKDLSSDDDGNARDSLYEYDENGYLVKEYIDKYTSGDYHIYEIENGQIGQELIEPKGNVDSVIYYEWK